jgi:hypothetical protein
MLTLLRRLLACTVGPAILTVLAMSPVTAAAEHNTDIRNFTFTEVDVNPCDGHSIQFSGTFQVVDQFTADGKVVTFHTSTAFKGVSGVDLTTGAQVRWVGTSTANDGLFLSGERSFQVGTLMMRWVQPGPDNDFVVRARNLTILDANGIERVSFGQFETECA